MAEILIEGPGKNALGSALIDNLSAQMDAADGAPHTHNTRADVWMVYPNAPDNLNAGDRIDYESTRSVRDCQSFAESTE